MRHLRLRTKMILAIGLPIVILGLAGTVHARLTLASISHDELDRRSLSIARDLEVDATEGFLTNDLFGLHRIFTALETADPDVRYVMLLDSQGEVRLSTLGTRVPQGLRVANPIPGGAGYSFALLDTDEGHVRDLAYQLQQGRLGVLRIGLATRRLDTRVDALTTNLLGLTAATLGVGLMVSYAVATVLTRPIARLADLARAVGRGRPADHGSLYDHPDVGALAREFDDMTERLREKEAERGQLLAQVITAQEDERRRIARELHDDAGQALSSLVMGLARVDRASGSPEVATLTAGLRVQAGEALELMRHLARDLRPSTLDDLGLAPALRAYVEDFGREHGIDAHFSAEGLVGVRLRAECETALYRIAQEALTNVARHANAHHVSVVLNVRGAVAVLVVEDDGAGFDAARVLRSDRTEAKLGLLGMEERAQLVGGTLTIESNSEMGTAVFVEVPLEVTS
ncbi:MAG: ATP-binding protein [Dehalococcoidia bacterium]